MLKKILINNIFIILWRIFNFYAELLYSKGLVTLIRRETAMDIKNNIKSLRCNIPNEVTLLAVSKTKPLNELEEAYNAGIRDFG